MRGKILDREIWGFLAKHEGLFFMSRRFVPSLEEAAFRFSVLIQPNEFQQNKWHKAAVLALNFITVYHIFSSCVTKVRVPMDLLF